MRSAIVFVALLGLAFGQYAIEYTYSGSSCSPPAIAGVATRTGTCYEFGHDYFYASCSTTSDLVTISNCTTDSQCDSCSVVDGNTVGLCAAEDDNKFSIIFQCSNSLPVLQGTYITVGIYDAPGCGTQSLVEYTAANAGVCVKVQDNYLTYKCSTQSVTIYECSDPDCTQNCRASNVPSKCLAFDGGSILAQCKTN